MIDQGSGSLGSYIVKQLLADGFHVTALTRGSSATKFPAGVSAKNVDYGSLESIKEALDGTDAVVSTIGTLGIGQQLNIVDAAYALGVKRYIPSEFGVNTRVLGEAMIAKILAGKIKIVNYLEGKAKENPEFTWTGVSNGLFFDIVSLPACGSALVCTWLTQVCRILSMVTTISTPSPRLPQSTIRGTNRFKPPMDLSSPGQFRPF